MNSFVIKMMRGVYVIVITYIAYLSIRMERLCLFDITIWTLSMHLNNSASSKDKENENERHR